MNYAIVFSSVTGNTAQLAGRLAAVLPKESGAYFGAPSPEAAQADLILAGFWTDKGACSKGMAEFLESLHNKQVFLFGTAGFGGSEAYFAQILDRVRIHLDPSNQVISVLPPQPDLLDPFDEEVLKDLVRSGADPDGLRILLEPEAGR